jgi:hypothetical protein
MSLAEVAGALRRDLSYLLGHVALEHVNKEVEVRKGNTKGVQVLAGEYTSPDGCQWRYVLAFSSRKTTIYPMGWYFDRKGIHLMQLDADGPATYMGPHVLDRYRQRYFKDADVLTALKEFHERNYDKASEPRNYKNHPNCIASAIEDGYLLGQMLNEENVVRYHTFYDVAMGEKIPDLKELRRLLEWRRYYNAMTPVRKKGGAQEYVNWGRGYEIRLERLCRAA